MSAPAPEQGRKGGILRCTNCGERRRAYLTDEGTHGFEQPPLPPDDPCGTCGWPMPPVEARTVRVSPVAASPESAGPPFTAYAVPSETRLLGKSRWSVEVHPRRLDKHEAKAIADAINRCAAPPVAESATPDDATDSDFAFLEATLTVVTRLGEATIFPADADRIHRLLALARSAREAKAERAEADDVVAALAGRLVGAEAALRKYVHCRHAEIACSCTADARSYFERRALAGTEGEEREDG